MSFVSQIGESSAAGASREASARRSAREEHQILPISSFTSFHSNASQSVEPGPGPSARREQTRKQPTPSVIDLEEPESSVGQSSNFDTPTSGQGQPARDEEMPVAAGSEERSIPQTMNLTHQFKSSKTHFIYQEAEHDLWIS